MISEKDVLRALGRVLGPDGHTPLPQSGAVAGISILEGKVFVSVAVDPARSAALEPMRRSAEAAIKGLPGVVQALVTLTAEARTGAGPATPAGPKPPEAPPKPPAAPPKPPAGPKPPAPAAGGPPGPRAQAARSGNPVGGVQKIIAVASGKGGVGKSTTAANLALALAALGLQVGILDADIYGPSMPRLFGLKGKPELDAGRIMRPLQAYGLKIMSIGFLVEEDTAMIWRGPMVMSALTQMLREVAWSPLDVMVVDMPPGTGDAQLTMAQAVPLAGAVIVSTPQDLALIDARRAITMFGRVEVPILGLIENMSYFVCPHCGGRTDVFAHGGARHEAERLGTPFLGEVPLDMAIRETSDAGRPIVISAPDGPHAQVYRQIAERVWTRLSGATSRPAPRITVED